MVPEKSCDQVTEPEPVPEKVCKEQVVDQKCIEAVRDIPKEVCTNFTILFCSFILFTSFKTTNPEFKNKINKSDFHLS